jgi:putative aminopeptidase FrvX
MNYSLLEKLCSIPGASGNEKELKEFILHYVNTGLNGFRSKPHILNDYMQDCFGLAFGTPDLAIFAHIDTTGFMVRYENQLVPVGSPDFSKDDKLVGIDSLGEIECGLKSDHHHRLFHDFGRAIDRGTYLTYKPDFQLGKNKISSPYLDNRLGVWLALQLAAEIDNVLIFFTTWEEHGGGSVAFLTKLMFEKYKVRKALIADVTWVTDGIHPGQGVVISIKDRHIPRRSFVNRIIEVAHENNINYQLEVENDGSSDGGEIQKLPFPVDWCFIGPPVMNVHSSHETVSKKDIQDTISLYSTLIHNSDSW